MVMFNSKLLNYQRLITITNHYHPSLPTKNHHIISYYPIKSPPKKRTSQSHVSIPADTAKPQGRLCQPGSPATAQQGQYMAGLQSLGGHGRGVHGDHGEIPMQNYLE